MGLTGEGLGDSTINYDEIFEAYYTLYRNEAETPTSEDDEYKIALPLANEAVNRWANYDNTMWTELYNTLQLADDGAKTLSNSTVYDAPEDMRKAGGHVTVRDSNGAVQQRYRIIQPEEVQFQSSGAQYAYFIGDPNNGFTMNLNPAPPSNLVGSSIDYVYYRKPEKITDGTSVVQMSQPYFVVHRMLANRFRGSRNPFYTSAKGDAEDVLKTMKLENVTGTWGNPWSLPDRSGSSWGE